MPAVHGAHLGHDEEHPVGVAMGDVWDGRIDIFMERVVHIVQRDERFIVQRQALPADRARRIVRVHEAGVVGIDARGKPVDGVAQPLLLFRRQVDHLAQLLDAAQPVPHLPLPIRPLLLGHIFP